MQTNADHVVLGFIAGLSRWWNQASWSDPTKSRVKKTTCSRCCRWTKLHTQPKSIPKSIFTHTNTLTYLRTYCKRHAHPENTFLQKMLLLLLLDSCFSWTQGKRNELIRGRRTARDERFPHTEGHLVVFYIFIYLFSFVKCQFQKTVS